MGDQVYKFVPYVGFVPFTDEDDETVKKYKFVPFYGFVEFNQLDKDIEDRPKVNPPVNPPVNAPQVVLYPWAINVVRGGISQVAYPPDIVEKIDDRMAGFV